MDTNSAFGEELSSEELANVSGGGFWTGVARLLKNAVYPFLVEELLTSGDNEVEQEEDEQETQDSNRGTSGGGGSASLPYTPGISGPDGANIPHSNDSSRVGVITIVDQNTGYSG